jgi:small conductance mechanosensitive channel
MNRSLTVRCLIVVTLLAAVPPLPAQETAPPLPATTSDVEIPVEELRLLLVPLTSEQLVVEADAWQAVLQAKAQLISDAEIQARRADGEAKTELLQQAAGLREERTALMDRTRAVIDALEAKGGEVEPYRKYIAAVSGLTIDATDVGATWTTVTSWLRSKEGGIRWGKNIGLFIITLIIFSILARVAGAAVRRSLATLKQPSVLLLDFLANITRKAVFFIGIVVALSVLEVPIGPFLAAIGGAGFVLGFALQGTLSNFASGLMILLYRPFEIGDFVNVAGVTGTVDAMTMVSTTLKTPDNQTVVVPNSQIWGSVITNVTGSDTRRVDLTFGIGYEDNIEDARGILERIASEHPLVLAEPKPVVQLHELADSSVNFVVRPWTNTADYWTVYWDLTRTVKERFDAEGISIPFPQRDVHVHTAAATAAV